MVPTPKYKIMILGLSCLCLCLLPPSRGGSSDKYEEWIKWNVKNHQEYLTRRWNNNNKKSYYNSKDKKNEQLVPVSVSESLAQVVIQPIDMVGLDVRLQLAETNQTRIVVNPSFNGTGSDGDFRTISEAIDHIPLHNSRRIIIELRPGLYREKIHIPKTKAFVTLMGDANNPPIITGNDTASVTGGDGNPLRTYHSATVAVDADYFIAFNIIFENTAAHEVGRIMEQGVALRISGSKAAFYSCQFYGYQDTLYDHKGLHYYKDCFIQGSVDFIFGYARSFYQNCTLNSISKKTASVTAQKRNRQSMESGFSFKDCKVTGTGEGRMYLGRAWGDYSRVVFSYTFLDKLILPQGWSNWGHPSRNLLVYYGEYKCSGAGSNMSGRVAWARTLTEEEAQPFIGPHYIEADTWLTSPST